MRLIILTKMMLSVYFLISAFLMVFVIFAVIRNKIKLNQIDGVMLFVVLFPLAIMNDKMRLKFIHSINPNR
jgi:hypothetical protein